MRTDDSVVGSMDQSYRSYCDQHLSRCVICPIAELLDRSDEARRQMRTDEICRALDAIEVELMSFDWRRLSDRPIASGRRSSGSR